MDGGAIDYLKQGQSAIFQIDGWTLHRKKENHEPYRDPLQTSALLPAEISNFVRTTRERKFCRV